MVVPAPLLPGVFRHGLSGAELHIGRVGGSREIPQTLSDLLQHLLAAAAVVGRGEGLGSHLPVSFGLLPSLHVRTCMWGQARLNGGGVHSAAGLRLG